MLHELEARVEHGEGLAGTGRMVAHVVVALVMLQQRFGTLAVLLVSIGDDATACASGGQKMQCW